MFIGFYGSVILRERTAMAPNLESHTLEESHSFDSETTLILTPLEDTLFEENNPVDDTPDLEELVDLISVPIDINYIPLEQNLRELLVSI